MIDQLSLSVESLFSTLKDYPLLRALSVLLASLVVAWVAQWIVKQGVHRLTRHTSTSVDDQIVRLLFGPVFWSVALLGLLLSVRVAELPEQYLSPSRSTVFTLLIFIWTGFAFRVSRILITAISRHGNENSLIRTQTLPLFTNMAAILIIALSVYFMFQTWNIDMTAWLASAGIAGIAIGFAAKDTLANLFSGVFILADSPYKLGDYVVLDNAERGKITHIGIRSTRLLTRDDVEVTVPNSIMGNSKIINESGGPHQKYRIRVQVGVAYGTDIDHVEAILLEVASAEEEVCRSPAPRVRFRVFGASSLDFELLCWVDEPELRGRLLHQLNCAVYKAFQAENIEIPYAKQDLYIKESP